MKKQQSKKPIYEQPSTGDGTCSQSVVHVLYLTCSNGTKSTSVWRDHIKRIGEK